MFLSLQIIQNNCRVANHFINHPSGYCLDADLSYSVAALIGKCARLQVTNSSTAAICHAGVTYPYFKWNCSNNNNNNNNIACCVIQTI